MSQSKTGVKLLSEKRITLNAKKAEWLLTELKAVPGDRTLRKPHVAKLARAMTQGQFLAEQVKLTVCQLGDTTYRLNGQHTASAVLQLNEDGETFSIPNITLQTYVADTEEDMRQIYARIDRGATRSNSDVTMSILHDIPEFEGVSKQILRLLPIGLAFCLHESTAQRRLYAGEDAAYGVISDDALVKSQTVVKLMKPLNGSRTHDGYMFRGPVIAAMYATITVDSEDAVRFWTAVSTGIGLTSIDEPAARLRQILQALIISGGHQTSGKKITVGEESVYRVCLHAWNRFRENGVFGTTLRPTSLKSRPKLK